MQNTIKTNQGLHQWQKDNLVIATQSVGGYWYSYDKKYDSSILSIEAENISTDTRKIKRGDIFLALSGDNFDGHDYVTVALEKGAVAIIVERPLPAIALPQLVVKDSRLALGALAAYRRNLHKDLKVIAITGSSGKTTVKEMLASIFRRIAPTLVTRGNLNNDLGVPMMLLELTDEQRFAILELGANHIGEIAYTANLVNPDVACILNIGTAHLGEFGGRDKIAEAKAEIYQSLKNPTNNSLPSKIAIAVYPENDDYTKMLKDIAIQSVETDAQAIGFGKTAVTATKITMLDFSSEFTIKLSSQPESNYLIQLPLAGEHNISNALAVTACARALGVSMDDIITGLESVKPPKGRLYSQMVGNHRLIDDAYNANPHSVRASAQVVAKQQGLKVIVLGDIAELGELAEQEHYSLGVDIAHMQVDILFSLGEFSEIIAAGARSVESSQLEAKAFNNKQTLLTTLTKLLADNKDNACTVLFKGSRFMKMETLFSALVGE